MSTWQDPEKVEWQTATEAADSQPDDEQVPRHVSRGLATGILHLWSETGDHVATVTQTAMLRSL